MNYVFLTNQYVPHPGATGLCVHFVARELAAHGHNVNVICYSEGKSSNEKIDNINVIKIRIPFFLRDSSHKSVVVQRLSRYSSLIHKLYHFQSYPLRSSALCENFYAVAYQLVMKYGAKNTIVIASYTPVEACSAIIKLKRIYPELKTCFYSTDTLSNEQGDDGFLSAKMRTKKGFKWEKKIFESVDAALIMECHKEHYMREVFKPYHNKMLFANFPFLRKPDHQSVNEDLNKEVKQLVYAGTLYHALRNPSFLCDLLTKVEKRAKIQAIFMGGGDCDDIMKKYEQQTNGKIRFLGMQPHTVASKNIQNADLLLSIGNEKSPMAPSKIYEYMATGKPIIHTYKWDSDPCIEPLRKYGNALLVDERTTVDIDAIVTFIINSKVVKFQNVAKQFESSMPEYTAELIEKL